MTGTTRTLAIGAGAALAAHFATDIVKEKTTDLIGASAFSPTMATVIDLAAPVVVGAAAAYLLAMLIKSAA